MSLTRWQPLHEIERWQPLRELETLQREMNRLFGLSPIIEGAIDGSFIPAAEIDEDETAVYLKLELPGIDPKNVDIQVTAESVTIGGDRKYEQTTEEKGVKRSEFRYGSFQRTIPLPVNVQNTKAEADYKDGILHLTLPKAEEEQNKVFKISLGE